MLVAVDGYDRAQHREPEEAKGGCLIDPDDWKREHVARGHAHQEQADDHDQDGGGDHLDGLEKRRAAFEADRQILCFTDTDALCRHGH